MNADPGLISTDVLPSLKGKFFDPLTTPPANTLPSNGDRHSSFIGAKPEQLYQVLERHRGERHLIVLQDFPDPDALSTGWAYQLICESVDIQTDIVYAGAVSHQENIILVRLTNLPCHRWNLNNQAEADFSKYQGAVFVDHQGSTSQFSPLLKQYQVPIIAIIDHHSPQHLFKAEFEDIRPNTGATATILTQYCKAHLLDFDTSNLAHVHCSTALMHGLRSETNQLLRAREEDFQAAAYLSRFYDSQLLDAISQAARSKRVMDVIERALKNRVVSNNFCVSGVGYLRYEDRDAIPQAADFLLTEENVHTAVVYGIIRSEDGEREFVTGSLRTNKITLDPDEFLKTVFGQDSQGKFFGGGRTRAGGFEIALGFLSGCSENSDYTTLKWEVFDKQIKQKLSRFVNPEK